MRQNDESKPYYVEIPQKVGSTYRPTTEAETKRTDALRLRIERARKRVEHEKKVLQELENSCEHLTFCDKPGFGYDIRCCAACGKCLGLI